MPFQYQQRPQESFAARENYRDSASFDRMFNRDVTMFKPHAGDNNIRILPPTWPNADHYGYDLFVHYGVGPDRSSYLSLWKHHGKPDPIDEASAAAAKEGNEELERQLRATRRVAIWLIDRSDPDKGPMLWLAPATSVDRDIITMSRDRQTGEILAVDDPDNGYDIFFTKTGERLNTKYGGVAIARRPTPLHPDPAIKEQWLQYAVDNQIPSLLKFYSYERIASVFKGEAMPSEMEEVAPAATAQASANHVSHAPPPPAPSAAHAAPPPPPPAHTAPGAPPAPVATQAEANLAAQQAQAHQDQHPQQPAAGAPDLPPMPTRTRPASQPEFDDDIPF